MVENIKVIELENAKHAPKLTQAVDSLADAERLARLLGKTQVYKLKNQNTWLVENG